MDLQRPAHWPAKWALGVRALVTFAPTPLLAEGGEHRPSVTWVADSKLPQRRDITEILWRGSVDSESGTPTLVDFEAEGSPEVETLAKERLALLIRKYEGGHTDEEREDQEARRAILQARLQRYLPMVSLEQYDVLDLVLDSNDRAEAEAREMPRQRAHTADAQRGRASESSTARRGDAPPRSPPMAADEGRGVPAQIGKLLAAFHDAAFEQGVRDGQRDEEMYDAALIKADEAEDALLAAIAAELTAAQSALAERTAERDAALAQDKVDLYVLGEVCNAHDYIVAERDAALEREADWHKIADMRAAALIESMDRESAAVALLEECRQPLHRLTLIDAERRGEDYLMPSDPVVQLVYKLTLATRVRP